MTGEFQPLLGKRLRVTKLDYCGNPVPDDPCAMIVTNGFISVSLSSEVETGTDIVTRKADGSLCVNERMADSFRRFTVEITLCGVNGDLLSMLTNAEIYQGYGENRGITVAEATVDTAFALELWTGISGAACQPGVEEASGYLLLPFVNAGVLGDMEVNGEAAVDFSVTGAFTKGGNNWGVGPYDVLDNETAAAPLPTALDPLDHMLLIETGIAPPENTDGCQSMPSVETPGGQSASSSSTSSSASSSYATTSA